MRKHLNRLKLKWRVFAYLLIFCAILLVFLWLFQTVLLDSFYRAVKVMEIKSNAALILKNIDSQDLSTLVDTISDSGETSIDIVSADGTDVYSVENVKNNQFSKMTAQDKENLVSLALAQNGEYVSYNTVSFSGHKDFDGAFSGKAHADPPVQSIIFVKVVKNAAGDTIALLMNTQISPVNATVTTLRYQLYVITGVMILLSVFLAFLIARRVSKPIEEINKSAKVLAAGKYDIDFNGKGFREIGELSDTLNTAAAELSKVDTLRRELMANISHDLRTPLALLYSYAEMMHDFPAEISSEQTQIIMDEVQRLTTLVNDVLDISKLESGALTLNESQFDLTHSLSETVKRVGELIKKDGYQITFLEDGQVVVRADETKIMQVFYNLLINAIHYTGKDKTITVRQIQTPGRVRIEVSDTGDGIAPEDQPYIWDRYYKADKKHKRAVTGTGLGLSIVKKVIDLHGGECGVSSDAGNGSTFWFSLKRQD